MGMLLAFAPFIVFAVADRFVGPLAALSLAALAAAILAGRDILLKKTPKILDLGAVVLFGGLAIYSLIRTTAWSVIGVRLCVDIGILAIVIASMAIGRPFTIQYAQERVPSEHWNTPAFLKTNYVITGAWAVAFVVIVAAEALLLFNPDMPRQVGVLGIVAALIGAIKFSDWYPTRVRAEAVKAAAD